MSEIENIARSYIYDLLYQKAVKANESWLSENNVDPKYTNPCADYEAVLGIRSSAYEEFISLYPSATDESLGYDLDHVLLNDAKEYIEQNYDDEYMKKRIERKQNIEEILELQRDDLCLLLEDLEEYSDVERSYWVECSKSVISIKEMSSYLTYDGAREFVERYAPYAIE